MVQETSVAYEEVTDTSSNQNESQAEETVSERTYTQQEFNDAMAKMKAAERRKVAKQYEDLGDPNELRALKEQAEKRRTEEQMKRGEFEAMLKEMASKKDAEIQKRDAVIKEYKVDTPLLNAAAKYRSVNPDQVKALLKHQVRLGDEGNTEVLDADGAVRYNDSGDLYSVDDLVREFLDSNPHFVQPTPATSGSKNSIGQGKAGFDPAKLDMRNPEHRKMYNDYLSGKK